MIVWLLDMCVPEEAVFGECPYFLIVNRRLANGRFGPASQRFYPSWKRNQIVTEIPSSLRYAPRSCTAANRGDVMVRYSAYPIAPRQWFLTFSVGF
jgi:hypothetical protein